MSQTELDYFTTELELEDQMVTGLESSYKILEDLRSTSSSNEKVSKLSTYLLDKQFRSVVRF